MMSTSELDQLLDNLSWNRPIEVQNRAIEEILKFKPLDYTLLIMPKAKSCWENAAKILRKSDLPHTREIVMGLLEWLQDLNWPGAQIVIEILESINKITLIPFIEETLKKAALDGDYVWIYWIKYLTERLGIKREDFQEAEVFNLLDLAEE